MEEGRGNRRKEEVGKKEREKGRDGEGERERRGRRQGRVIDD